MNYTERDSKIGKRQGDAQDLSQAQPAPKQLNLNKLSDAGGLKACGCPTPARPIFESRAVYLKAMRLRTRGEFQRVVKEGHRRVGRFMCIDCRPGKHLKLGISASGRYGSAVERNRFKRLVREAFRLRYASLPPVELNIIPRQCAKKALQSEMTDELVRLLHEIK